MIVSGGRFGGRRIGVPAGRGVRPTPARVKEALFSILAPRLEGIRLLDLFAGSGAIGIEALSRGAASVTFIEADPRTATLLRTTLRGFGIEAGEAEVFALPAERAIKKLPHRYDLVFADPPYAQAPPLALFTALRDLDRLASGALLIYEHAAKSADFETPGFSVVRRERWGDTAMTFLELAGAQ